MCRVCVWFGWGRGGKRERHGSFFIFILFLIWVLGFKNWAGVLDLGLFGLYYYGIHKDQVCNSLEVEGLNLVLFHSSQEDETCQSSILQGPFVDFSMFEFPRDQI